MKNIIRLLIVGISVLVVQCGRIMAQQDETRKVKGIKLNYNAGFHFSNMIGKGVEKEACLTITELRNSYRGSVGGKRGNMMLPGYKLGFGITFDKTKNFAWGFDGVWQ